MSMCHRNRRTLQILAMAAALVFSLTACLGAAGRTGSSSAESPKSGGTAVLAMLQEPGSMNPLFNNEGGSSLALGTVLEPLFVAKADGTYEPLLATEVPTVENGSVSKDGRTVTFTLKEGITWSDGEPLTAEDLEFTYDVITNPKSTTVAAPPYLRVEDVTATGERTVEVTMPKVNPLYLDLFQVILPKHEFESSAVTNSHELARLPLGTGPFVFGEWNSGDTLTMKKNPEYWRDENLPRLDGITWKMVADRESAITSFAKGDYDSIWWLLTGDINVLQKEIEGGAPIEIQKSKTPGLTEWLWLNHKDPKNRNKPHPVLGDLAVRKAIDHAIDRKSIIDTVLKGNGTLTGELINVGKNACDIPATKFDPDTAKKLLDEAGWRVGDDGVRVKDGVKASLRFTTISGSRQRELYQQIIKSNLADVGIEVKIENADSSIIFSSYNDGGTLATGDYDIMMSLDGLRTPDPSQFVGYFTKDAIPSKSNPAGFTYSHWSSPEFDAAAKAAASTLDQAEARSHYADACRIFHEQRVAIPLYASVDAFAHSSRLSGVDISYWNGMWQNPTWAQWHLTG